MGILMFRPWKGVYSSRVYLSHPTHLDDVVHLDHVVANRRNRAVTEDVARAPRQATLHRPLQKNTTTPPENKKSSVGASYRDGSSEGD